MGNLDFSELTNDQIMELVIELMKEAARRHPDFGDAVRQAAISEAERAIVARSATDAETAALRALERSRIAQAAREKARLEHQEQSAKEFVDLEHKKRLKEQDFIRKFADALNLQPNGITIALFEIRSGCRRIVVNEGNDPYNRHHLIDYDVVRLSIKTKQDFVKIKPKLAEICAEFAGYFSGENRVALIGETYQW